MKNKDLSQKRSRTPKGHKWQQFGECSYCSLGNDNPVPVYEWQGQDYCIYCLVELKDRTPEKIAEIERPAERQNFVIRQSLTGNPTGKNISISQSPSFICLMRTNSSKEITIPLSSGTTDCRVYWGDGNYDEITSYNQTELTHTYTIPGDYRIEINGTFQSLQFNNSADADKLLRITRWGNNVWSTMNAAFYGCTNVVFMAIDSLDTSAITDWDSAFRGMTQYDGGSFTLASIFSFAGMTDGTNFIEGVTLSSAGTTALLDTIATTNSESSVTLHAGGAALDQDTSVPFLTLFNRGWTVTLAGGISRSDAYDYAEDGTATADSVWAGDAAANAIDGNLATEWQSGNPAGAGHWHKIELAEAKIIWTYGVDWQAKSTVGYPEAWTLEGSNNDVDWVELDTQTGQSYPPAVKTFDVDHGVPYKYYKLTIDEYFFDHVYRCTLSEVNYYSWA